MRASVPRGALANKKNVLRGTDIIPTEHQECVALCDYYKHKPAIGSFLIKICNEGKRGWGYAKKLKNIGLKAGVPDYFLAIPTDQYSGMWIEMKRPGGKPDSTRQDNWIKRLNEAGYFATYAFGCEDAITKIEHYLLST